MKIEDIKPITGLLNILREINVDAIQAEAVRTVGILVAGPVSSSVETLADVLRTDETLSEEWPSSAVRTAGLSRDGPPTAGIDLLIAVDADSWPPALLPASVPATLVHTSTTPGSGAKKPPRVALAILDQHHVRTYLAPVIVQELGEAALAAARRLPILRPAYAEWLLNETSRANAIYALSTGLAETIPVLNIPLNVADTVVLTKNQLIMVYKLALAAGRPPSPTAVIGELVAAIGAGFLWRQIARELVGLIPVVGLIPKVAVAYGGTYALGQAAQSYLIEGEVPGQEQLKELYAQAVERGRAFAHALTQRSKKTAKQLSP